MIWVLEVIWTEQGHGRPCTSPLLEHRQVSIEATSQPGFNAEDIAPDSVLDIRVKVEGVFRNPCN